MTLRSATERVRGRESDEESKAQCQGGLGGQQQRGSETEVSNREGQRQRERRSEQSAVSRRTRRSATER
eukprot:89562-Rhodomonas_salina.1